MLEKQLRTPKGTHPLPSIPRPDPDGFFSGVLRIGTIPESLKNNHPEARTTGFTAYAKPEVATRTMINTRAGIAPGEP